MEKSQALRFAEFFSTLHKSEAEVSEAQVFESTLSKAKMPENIQLETILASEISA